MKNIMKKFREDKKITGNRKNRFNKFLNSFSNGQIFLPDDFFAKSKTVVGKFGIENFDNPKL